MERRYMVELTGEKGPLAGRADEILTQLARLEYGASPDLTIGNLAAHIDRLAQDIWRLTGIAVQINGETAEERAEGLLWELHDKGLARITEVQSLNGAGAEAKYDAYVARHRQNKGGNTR